VESIGRFRLAAPAGLHVSSREQAIYAVKVWTGPDDWTERLAALGPKVKSRPELGNGIRAVWYEENSVLLLEASKMFGDHAFRVLRDAPKGKEPQAEKLVANVINGYRPSVEAGFCVGAGAVRLGPAQLETSKLGLRAKDNAALKVTYSTQTVTTPDVKQYMDTQEEEEVMRLVKGRLEVFKQGARVIAGLEGVEIQLAMAPPNEPEIVRYTWHFPGVGGDGTKPKINVVAFTTRERRMELNPIWEALLLSLVPVPVGAKL